jgi:hypothetical protein
LLAGLFLRLFVPLLVLRSRFGGGGGSSFSGLELRQRVWLEFVHAFSMAWLQRVVVQFQGRCGVVCMKRGDNVWVWADCGACVFEVHVREFGQWVCLG